MIRQVPLTDPEMSVEACQAKLRGIEARIGGIVDIIADTDKKNPSKRVTIITANKSSDVAANSLILLEEGAAAPQGKTLLIAGTAWIGGDKKVVKAFR